MNPVPDMNRVPEAGTDEFGSGLLDPARLAAVRASGLRAGPNEKLERYSRMASAALGTPVTLLSIVDDDGQHFALQRGLSEPWRSQGGTPLSHSYCRHVVDDGQPLIVNDSSADDRFRDHPATRDLGVAAYAGVPVRDRDGFVLGSFCAIDTEPHAWSPDELALLGDFAASIESELALRDASRELLDRLAVEQREHALAEALNNVATATNRAEGIRTTASALVAQGSSVVGASIISLAIVEGNEVIFHHGPGMDDDIAEQWAAVPDDTAVPMVAAAISGENHIVSDRSGFERWPVMATEVEELGLESFAALAIHDPDTDLRASVGLGWQHPLPAGVVPESCDRLVQLTSQALVRAQRFDSARSQARLLEQLVIPSSLPTASGLRFRGAYLAPSTVQRVGGDLYDVVVRSDGAVGVVIADAVGHDLEATRAAARVRHAIGVLTLEGTAPSHVLRAVNLYLRQSSSSRLVTCAYALIEPDREAVTLANAGHPSTRLVTGGEVHHVGPTSEPLLGLADFAYSEVRRTLEPGDLLLGFTDGLIERPGTSIIEGEAWLDGLLPDLGSLSADGAVDRLTSLLSASARVDDVAVIAVKRTISESSAPEADDVHARSWPVEALVLGDARRELVSFMNTVGLAGLSDDVALIATELLTNARSASTDGDQVQLLVRRTTTGLTIEVENGGPVFEPDRPMPDQTSVRGRGLAIVEALADAVVVERVADRVTIRATLLSPGAN